MKRNPILYPLSLALCLAGATTLHATDGIWTSYTNGNYSTPGNWSGGAVANGTDATAYFSTLNITNNVTVTLDINPSLGTLQFGDTTPSHNWTLSGGNLILQTSTGVPTIAVTNQTATLNSTLLGNQGFNKTGAGQLNLGNADSFSGGTFSNLAGMVALNNANALSGLANVTVSSGAVLALPSGTTYANVPSFLSGSGIGRGALYYSGTGGSATWPGPIVVNNATIGNYGAAGGYSFPNVISGSNGLSFFAGGGAATHLLTVNLSGANTYSGATTLNGTFGSSYRVNLSGGANRLPTTTTLNLNTTWGQAYGMLDLGGNNQTLAGLTATFGTGPNTNYLISSSASAPTLTVTTNGVAGVSGTELSVQGGNNGVLILSNITLNVTADPAYDLRTIIQNNSTIVLQSGTYNSSFYTALGRTGNGTLYINNGLFSNAGELLMAYGGTGTGTLNVGGAGVADTHFIRLGNNTPGNTANLNAGGTIRADQIYANVANVSNYFNFNGGVLQANTSPAGGGANWFNSPNVTAQVRAGGAIINTQDKNGTARAVMLANALLADPNSAGGGLTKLGAGTLTLAANTNTYTGNTVVSNGILAVDGTLTNSAVLVASPASGTTNALSGTGTVAMVTVNLNGTVDPGRPGTAGTLNVTTLTCNAGSYLRFDLADPTQVGNGINDLLNLGSLNVAGPTYLTPAFLYNPPTAGRYVVATYTSATGLANLAIDPSWAGSRAQPGLDTSTLGEIAIWVTNSASPNPSLYWYGGVNGNWDLATTLNWAGGTDYFYNEDGVILDDSAQTSQVNLVGTLEPASVTFNNSVLPYTLSGSGKLSGPTGLTLNGTTNVTLATDNDYTGVNQLNAAGATLQIGNGGTHGTIGSGDVVFTSTATGAALVYDRTDALTLNNRLTGGSTYQPSVVVNSGALTLGGTLDNAYAVATVNNNATLVLAKASSASVHALGGVGALTVNAGGTAVLGGTGGDQIQDARDVQLNGGSFDLAGLNEKINNLKGYGSLSSSAGAATLTCGATLNVSGGLLTVSGVTINPTGSAVPNVVVSSNATLNLLSGTITTGGYVGIGGQMNILGGLLYSGSEVMPGFNMANGGPATVNIAGGAVSCFQYRVSDTYSGTTYLQTNGVLYAGEVKPQLTTPAWLYFNGGTLAQGNWPVRNNGVWLHDVANVLVQQGGGILNVSNQVLNIPLSLAHDPALLTADGGITKLGSGTLILSGTNTYTGPTTLSVGKLALTNNGSIAASSAILVSAGTTFDVSQVAGGFGVAAGQTLEGNGTVLGPVTVQAGATLAPGTASLGTLALSNALTLVSGSTNVFRLNAAATNNDAVVGISSLTCGGTLVVSNTGGAFVAGQSFRLFNAAVINPAPFDVVQLPALGAGLAWTNMLTQNGTLAVVSSAPPIPPSVQSLALQPDHNISLSVTGVVGTAWSLHAATNVALPLPWGVVLSGTVTNSPFSVTDLNATNYAQRFYYFTAP